MKSYGVWQQLKERGDKNEIAFKCFVYSAIEDLVDEEEMIEIAHDLWCEWIVSSDEFDVYEEAMRRASGGAEPVTCFSFENAILKASMLNAKGRKYHENL